MSSIWPDLCDSHDLCSRTEECRIADGTTVSVMWVKARAAFQLVDALDSWQHRRLHWTVYVFILLTSLLGCDVGAKVQIGCRLSARFMLIGTVWVRPRACN